VTKLTDSSFALSSCECGYSERHRSQTPLQTLHGFNSEELAPFVRWIPDFWSVCLDGCTLPKQVQYFLEMFIMTTLKRKGCLY